MIRNPNRYTCSTLICADQFIYKLRGKDVFWTDDGCLVERNKNGVLGECRTHFPDSLFILACRIQNKWPWTRKLLSL
jgi:hypothetical protein